MQRSRYVTNERYIRGGSDFVIDYHIWTTLVSLTVMYFGFDSMNLKHVTSNLVLFILLPQNDIIL